MWIYLLLAWHLDIVSVVDAQCYQDWILHDGSCYGIGEALLTWPDAQEVCQSYQAKLAEIETSAENDYLKTMARAKGGDNYWVGGNDIFHEGIWEWVSTKEPIYPFTDWNPGEPNDDSGFGDCLALRKLFEYRWNDWPCDDKYNFICETSPQEVVVG